MKSDPGTCLISNLKRICAKPSNQAGSPGEMRKESRQLAVSSK